jgi:L-asparaginase / beta-aspartyl-peptidase
MNKSGYKASNFGILIHGGAETSKTISKSSERKDKIEKFLRSSVSFGFDALKQGNSAIDSVETSVSLMEGSGVFNAGMGACLTIDKKIEMDASIMDGRDLSAGSVGMVNGIRNPIKLARQVMKRTDHVMMVSEGATRFAELLNMDIKRIRPSQQALNKYMNIKRNMKSRWKKNNDLLYMLLEKDTHHFGTVGAVAIDKEGNVASAVSTGGRWLKMPGRIGDSAVIGAGFYADNRSGAACATGNGEYIMRTCMCKYACDQMQSKNALLSSKRSITQLTERFGKNTGGIITVDRKGRFGIAHNTRFMQVALISSKDEKTRLYSKYNHRAF